MFQIFLKTFGPKLDAAFAGSQLTDDLAKIHKEAKAKFESPKFNLSQLKDFSPFLANFLGSDHPEKVEVPGQYKGFSRPDQSRHITISSFEPGLSVFHSIRKPMKISMLGSDGNRYGFLVKAGEDLRQDQRIENLFEICNICLAHESSARSKNLSIKTYKIIPFSPALGLIEFVSNTTPLKEFINSEPKAQAEMLQAQVAYSAGMKRMTNAKDDNSAFLSAGKPGSEEICRNYDQTVGLMENTHLKSSILRMSSSMKGFYYIRKNFITSHAVLSVMQWILGKCLGN